MLTMVIINDESSTRDMINTPRPHSPIPRESRPSLTSSPNMSRDVYRCAICGDLISSFSVWNDDPWADHSRSGKYRNSAFPSWLMCLPMHTVNTHRELKSDSIPTPSQHPCPTRSAMPLDLASCFLMATGSVMTVTHTVTHTV
jgi:hypothetical protein